MSAPERQISHDHNIIERVRDIATSRAALVASVAALATGVIAGCGEGAGYTQEGTVHLGANGKEYIIPNGAERPVYKNRKDCVEDVRNQISAIEKQNDGVAIKEKPVDLCQPVKEYDTTSAAVLYPLYFWYGPITARSSVWQSNLVASWNRTIEDDTFAAKGSVIPDEIEPAPADAEIGDTETMDEENGEGFGESAQSYDDESESIQSAGEDDEGSGSVGGEEEAPESFGGGED